MEKDLDRYYEDVIEVANEAIVQYESVLISKVFRFPSGCWQFFSDCQRILVV